jgi:hypothetical protein
MEDENFLTSLCRDSIERTVPKVEDQTCMISVGNYMPVQSMMPPTAVSMNQSPTSTTMDHLDPRDRYHPALMSPHFLADSRRMKAETSHGMSLFLKSID